MPSTAHPTGSNIFKEFSGKMMFFTNLQTISHNNYLSFHLERDIEFSLFNLRMFVADDY